MRLTNRQLQAALDALTKAHQKAHAERKKIAEHCNVVYGVDPADVDNNEFIDGCDGGCGTPNGMTTDAFDRSMRECMEMAGIEMPNVEVTGAARLHRAASRERSERGRPPGWAWAYAGARQADAAQELALATRRLDGAQR